MNTITQVFEGKTVSTVEKDGQHWFIAGDVARALGYRDANHAVQCVDKAELGYMDLCTRGGKQRVRIINESGLYHLTFRSKKPAAQRFRQWITGEVIPAIRKNGGYVTGQEKMPAAEQLQTTQTIKQESQRVAGVNAAEEREARWNAFRGMRGKPAIWSGKY